MTPTPHLNNLQSFSKYDGFDSMAHSELAARGTIGPTALHFMPGPRPPCQDAMGQT